MAQIPSKPLELGELMASTIGAVVKAQEKMDRYTLERKAEYEKASRGTLALPPLWYLFKDVFVELEMSATVGQMRTTGEAQYPESGIYCRTLDPAMVSLYGYQASSGLRVKVHMSPKGSVPIKDDWHGQRKDP